MAQLDSQYGALQTIHSVVVSHQRMLIFSLLAPVTQHAYSVGIVGVVSCDHAALSVRPEILARIEAKATQIADSPNSTTLVLRAMSLRRIFDHNQTMAPGDFQNRIHISGLAIEMHR